MFTLKFKIAGASAARSLMYAGASATRPAGSLQVTGPARAKSARTSPVRVDLVLSDPVRIE